METIVEKFMESTKIPETENHTVEKIMEYLSSADSVNKMIVATEMGLPALAGVLKGLEEKFADSDFPLAHEKHQTNATNRRNIGWMIKYIMREYGCKQIANSQTRIGMFAKSKCFTTASRYKKSDTSPRYKVLVQSIAV